MKTSLIIGVISSLGVVALICNTPALTTAYVIITTVVFAAVALGGVLKYTSQEMIDFRDIYREKDRLQKQKIENLKLRIIDLEKEKLQNESRIVYDTVIVNGGMEY